MPEREQPLPPAPEVDRAALDGAYVQRRVRNRRQFLLWGVAVVGMTVLFSVYFFLFRPMFLSGVSSPVVPGIAPTTAVSGISADLIPCLELQSEHTHQIYSSDSSFDCPTCGMSVGKIKTNPCEDRASLTGSTREILFLLNSRDPLVIIRLASNPNTPAVAQWSLYRKRLANDWGGLEPAMYTQDSPWGELLFQLEQNPNLDGKIAEDIFTRFTVHDVAVEVGDIFTLLKNPRAAFLLLRIARLDNLRFNIEMAAYAKLDEDTVRYLAQNISYTLSESDQYSYDPPYQRFLGPNQEVHHLLALQQDVPKELLLTYLNEFRECSRGVCGISPDNLAKIEGDVLTEGVKNYFFSSPTVVNGLSRGVGNYLTLLKAMGTSKKTSDQSLQLLIDTFADAEVKALLLENFNRIATLVSIDAALAKKYPTWRDSEIADLRQALGSAQQNLNLRQGVSALPAVNQRDQRRLVDIKQLQTVIELYLVAQGQYPASGRPLNLGVDATCLGDRGFALQCTGNVLMQNLMRDPAGGFYRYTTIPERSDQYCLKFTLESPLGELLAGKNYASEVGIRSGICGH